MFFLRSCIYSHGCEKSYKGRPGYETSLEPGNKAMNLSFLNESILSDTMLFCHRMEGKGEYVFPTGAKYIGDMKDGM